ncbi:MAG TPA: TlpA disulfide reductase family protein [Actinomycetes bacterium]|nr:TlpA disulfide reductase family protein [Actinomycetes bacterium]
MPFGEGSRGRRFRARAAGLRRSDHRATASRPKAAPPSLPDPACSVGWSGRCPAACWSWSSTGARGSVLVVNFWASWCVPCRAEQPELNKVAAAYRGRGVALVGVDVNDQVDSARAYTREFAVAYPSLVDPQGELAARSGVPGLPTTIVLDRDGWPPSSCSAGPPGRACRRGWTGCWPGAGAGRPERAVAISADAVLRGRRVGA